MESISVTNLRSIARNEVLAAGARGFVRFARDGDALLVTDAASRCADGGTMLITALERAGFVCRQAGALLGITPGAALLARLCARDGGVQIDWAGPLHPAQALADRLMRSEETDLTAAGRAFVLETARLCWQTQDKVLGGLAPLRAQAAALLREGDVSGFAPAGRLLANWADEQNGATKGDDVR